MASAFYQSGLKAILDGDVDHLADTIKVALIDTADYTFDAGHDFYSDISAGVVGTPGTLDNKTTTNGIFDADDEVFSGVSGDSIEAVVIYKDTGNPATSQLLAYLDGLNLTPNGGNITAQFNASGIYKIGTA